MSSLETRSDLLSIGAIAGEQLVEERLRFRAFAAVEQALLPREVDEPTLDLLGGHPRIVTRRQTARRSDESTTA